MGKYQAVVVDDEEAIATLMAAFLKQEGLEVKQFTNCHEALEAMKDIRTDLYFVDYLLPSMKGDQFMAKLRDEGETAPAILMTGMGRGHLEQETAEFFQDVLEKPFTLEDVSQVVHYFLK
ncbi:response regulator [Alkalibacillus salilacus]|uniref:DNA-binding NtrC family response regulator n=1 Tax=Alkalibacillus salilacus TaxID=284582 RepID=A0ABT9VHZ8_9BACI|nr:response regulator [Alkalibacillus salilacus]MDQ0160581.1 DNA-binding NtrC family response regulator [Alkalibacillus salilacus]